MPRTLSRLLLSAVLAAMAVRSEAAVHVANKDYPTIQAAIDAATTPAGSVSLEVYIDGGVYKENIVVGKRRLALLPSGAGSGPVVVEAFNRDKPAISILSKADNVKLSRLTIRGASSNNGVIVNNATFATIDWCEIHGNNRGIMVQGGSQVSIMSCTIHDNMEGAWVNGVGYTLHRYNKIHHNTGNGMSVSSCRWPTMWDNEYYNNGGYGLALNSNEYTDMRRCMMDDNKYNFSLAGKVDMVSIMDDTNLIDGAPVIYRKDKGNETIDSKAGYVALVNCTNMTIPPLTIKQNGQGLYLQKVSNSVIAAYHSTLNATGFFLYQCSNVTLTNCSSAADDNAMTVSGCTNVTVSGCNISKAAHNGLVISGGTGGNITGNTITNCMDGLQAASNPKSTTITGNSVSTNADGISIEGGESLTVRNNHADNNTGVGLSLSSECDGLTLDGNTMSGNGIDFDLELDDVSSMAEWNVGSGNTVNSRTIVFMANQTAKAGASRLAAPVVPANAGFVALVNCSGVSIATQVLTNNSHGAVLINSDHCSLHNVRASGNRSGIELVGSSDNSITSCALVANDYAGLMGSGSHRNAITRNRFENNHTGLALFASRGNQVFLNRFAGNAGEGNINAHAYVKPYNLFSTPTPMRYMRGSAGPFISYLGNWYDDYAGKDLNGNYVGDTPYAIAGNDDNDDPYPLISHPLNYKVLGAATSAESWHRYR